MKKKMLKSCTRPLSFIVLPNIAEQICPRCILEVFHALNRIVFCCGIVKEPSRNFWNFKSVFEMLECINQIAINRRSA